MINRLFYSLILLLCWPLVIAYLLWRSVKDPAYRQRFAERFAVKLPSNRAKNGIVLHAVSVGEFNAAKPIIKQLLQQYPQLPLTLTCTTPTASAAILQLQAEQPTIQHCYLPFDYPILVRRWLKFMQPQLFIILETELWPNLLANCKAFTIPTLVINARLSARSAKGYRRFSCFTKAMLADISQILAQDRASARRFQALGAKQVQVAGNIKYELSIPETSIALAQRIKPLIQGRRVWVAGSTHAGEDEILLQAYQQLKIDHPELLLVLAPRHPERFTAVAELLQQQKIAYVQRSSGQAPSSGTEVWLIDSMGELLTWYQLADFVFIGGSLIARGGHNPLEAMAFAKTVLSGPYIFNFQQVFQLLQKQDAYFSVSDTASIVSRVQQLITQPDLAVRTGHKAFALYQQQQGAVAQVMAKVAILLPMAGIKTWCQGANVAWFDPDFYPEFELAYFQPEFWQRRGLVTGQSTGRNTVWFVQQDNKQAVLRHYYRGGLVGKINKDTFWPSPVLKSRAMVEFRLLQQMRLWQLPVPRPCAALYQADRFGYRADILIERISSSTELAQLLVTRALNKAEWHDLGVLIARFHQYGVHHSDLNCHNILLDNTGQFWLIDFDKCEIRPQGGWCQQNLARLQRSLLKERSLQPAFNWDIAQWRWLVAGYNAQFTNKAN
ncbi:3-deoxy-D-manno-octulosonic acid transferase [Rheinheimera sp. D18]|nr:3-deoxy-D-manno-octulosonic acid transferase [Rheinheimera sp. D18]